MRLDDEYVEKALQDARRFQGAWTGTSGSLAAHLHRVITERGELLATIDELERHNKELRAVVERRQSPQPAEVPAEVKALMPNMTFVPAVPQKPAEFVMTPVGASLPPEQLDAAWNAIAARGEAAREQAEPISTKRIDVSASTTKPTTRLIGIAGRAGSGKNAVAAMIPGAVVVQLADPIYAAVASILGVPDVLLRQRSFKESPVAGIGKTPRQLLQTLGTEWGRTLVADDVWIRMAERRVDQLVSAGVPVIAVADVRFENEAAWIRSRGGEVWHVYRGGVCQDDHASEQGISIADMDRVLDNSGTLDDLRASVNAAFVA